MLERPTVMERTTDGTGLKQIEDRISFTVKMSPLICFILVWESVGCSNAEIDTFEVDLFESGTYAIF